MQHKIERINEQIKIETSKIINYELKDPRITGIISVLRAETDNDLYQSVLYVSIYTDSEEAKKKAFLGLQASSAYIRKQLAQRLLIRTVPKLIFKLDTSIEYSNKIEGILAEIKASENNNNQDD